MFCQGVSDPANRTQEWTFICNRYIWQLRLIVVLIPLTKKTKNKQELKLLASKKNLNTNQAHIFIVRKSGGRSSSIPNTYWGP